MVLEGKFFLSKGKSASRSVGSDRRTGDKDPASPSTTHAPFQGTTDRPKLPLPFDKKVCFTRVEQNFWRVSNPLQEGRSRLNLKQGNYSLGAREGLHIGKDIWVLGLLPPQAPAAPFMRSGYAQPHGNKGKLA